MRLFMFDIWVNWIENEIHSFNIPDFYEWRDTDNISLIKRIPIIKIHSDFFDYIENGMNELPTSFLKDIKNEAFDEIHYRYIPIRYCFAVTDGLRLIVIDTNGSRFPIKKSRMNLIQSQHLYHISRNMETKCYSFESKGANIHTLSPQFKDMLGLTRKERNLRQLLFDIFGDLSNEPISKIRYFYSEWNLNNYKKILNLNKDELINVFLKEISNSWGNNHEHLCYVMSKGNSRFEKTYLLESNDVLY